MDIGGWLQRLGLGQYEAAFRDNAVDDAVLPKLTADDLKEIGVVAVGHRRRLLDAISALGLSGEGAGISPAASIASAPTMSRPLAPASPAASAEHRPITVMFCDLVGSTSLAAKLDPEDWRNLVGSYLDAASAAVADLGGHVLKKLGDGLMALFGYPQAQENDGERATRAALMIQRALADLNARNATSGAPELAARIGLESGRVVVDSAGEVYGEAPNVAARVQSAAAPGEIWITRAVHRQIAGLFVAEDKGEYELKGVPEKTQLFRIVRVSGGGRRSGSRAPTPLVGRGEELDILTRRWERARHGDGQLALIVGEPGLGKSRLIEEFRARLAETPHTWVEWASSQLLQNTPLHPVAEWGRARFGGAEVAGEKRLADLEAALGSVGLDAMEYAPLLAPVIDAPLPSGRLPNLSPEELRSRQLAALAAWVLAGARTQPLVLAFEDLHWADPTSLDVLQALAERGAQAPLLILATTRPEFRPPWKLRSHHGVISLAPLDAGEIVRMVGEIATLHALSKDVIAGVSERSGGVPLFVEEVTRLLLERGEQGGVQAIPPTLQQSLAARLDRLGSAREIAQIGAVLGRGFSHALLQAVAGLDEPALRATLDRLADAELLFVEGVAPNASYRFKHALIQDAAYDSLLKSRRQTLHRRAAEVLLASASPEAEALAHHFTLGGQTELAIEWWGKAGDHALRRSAFAEAISHLGKAIELSDKASAAPRPREAAEAAPASQRLKLQTNYGQAVMWSKGYGAEETKAAFARVEELATEKGDAQSPFDAYYGRWARSVFGGDLGSARETAESFVRVAERPERLTEAGVGHRLLGMTLFLLGDFAQARAQCEQAVRTYNPDRDRDAKFRFGQDSAVGAVAYLTLAAWCVGDVTRARELSDDARARAIECAHAPTLANMYFTIATVEALRDDAEAARRAVESGVALSREHGLALNLAYGALLSAWAHAKLGARNAGSTELRMALAEYAGTGVKFGVPFFRGLLAEIEGVGADAEAALAEIDEALALADETGEHWYDAELHRIRGEVLVKQNPADPAPAEAAFLAAIAVAQQQKARSFELRAALSLAKLYQSTGRPIDARDVLGPALEGFSPTPEFPQIAEAKALFEALATDETVKADAARRTQRLKLQTSYGQAVMWSKGFAAEETKAALAQTLTLASQSDNAAERMKAHHARWAELYVSGQLQSAQEVAEVFLREAKLAGDAPAAASAGRLLGVTRLYQGRFAEARDLCLDALSVLDPAWEASARRVHGNDSGIAAKAYLAMVAWSVGDVIGAAAQFEQALTEAEESEHAPTIANTYAYKATHEMARGDAEATLRAAGVRLDVAEKNGLNFYASSARMELDWARAQLGDADGLARLRGHKAFIGQGGQMFAPLYYARLAELEAERTSAEEALTSIDHAIEAARGSDIRYVDSLLHHIRGDILLRRDPANAGPAEDAYLTAIAVAREQGARSFELRAALSLAKLYQSTGRTVEAHDVLGPALEGFSPTPEFPQIAEAKALIEAIAETEEVKASSASLNRRLRLQVAYGNALISARGYSAPETRAAFERARALSGATDDAAGAYSASYGLWVSSLVRGELASIQEATNPFKHVISTNPLSPVAGVAHRVMGTTHWFAGEFVTARGHLERALALFDPTRDADLAFVFGQDLGVSAKTFLALTLWPLGETDIARRQADEMIVRADQSGHVPTIVYGHLHKASFELTAHRPERAVPHIETSVRLAHDNEMPMYILYGEVYAAWADGYRGRPDGAVNEMRSKINRWREQVGMLQNPLLASLLAEIETASGETGAALATIDQTIAASQRTGQRWFDAELHRIRGEILGTQNPGATASAEAAFLAAIALARSQKARSFELRAALSLAKLYQRASRPTDAYDVLGPALEGFSPTPEFPTIKEAIEFMAAIKAAG